MVVLGKKWIDERKATCDEEAHILLIFSHGTCYRLIEATKAYSWCSQLQNKISKKRLSIWLPKGLEMIFDNITKRFSKKLMSQICPTNSAYNFDLRNRNPK